MTGRKTERLYASASLDGDGRASVMRSLEEALASLELKASSEDREVLFDTLDISIERTKFDDRTFLDALSDTYVTYAEIAVSAEAFRNSATSEGSTSS